MHLWKATEHGNWWAEANVWVSPYIKHTFEEQAMTEVPRPEVIIFSHLTENSVDILVEIQDELIRCNPGLKSLRVKREWIHVIFIAVYKEDELESLFNMTIDDVKGEHDLTFELDEFDEFGKNLVQNWSRE